MSMMFLSPPPRGPFTPVSAKMACCKTCQRPGLLTPSNFCLLASTETLWLKLPVKYVLKPWMPHQVNCTVVTQADRLVKACALSWAQEKEIQRDLTVRDGSNVCLNFADLSLVLEYVIILFTLQSPALFRVAQVYCPFWFQICLEL